MANKKVNTKGKKNKMEDFEDDEEIMDEDEDFEEEEEFEDDDFVEEDDEDIEDENEESEDDEEDDSDDEDIDEDDDESEDDDFEDEDDEDEDEEEEFEDDEDEDEEEEEEPAPKKASKASSKKAPAKSTKKVEEDDEDEEEEEEAPKKTTKKAASKASSKKAPAKSTKKASKDEDEDDTEKKAPRTITADDVFAKIAERIEFNKAGNPISSTILGKDDTDTVISAFLNDSDVLEELGMDSKFTKKQAGIIKVAVFHALYEICNHGGGFKLADGITIRGSYTEEKIWNNIPGKPASKVGSYLKVFANSPAPASVKETGSIVKGKFVADKASDKKTTGSAKKVAPAKKVTKKK